MAPLAAGQALLALPRLLDTYHAQGAAKMEAVHSAISRMMDSLSRVRDPKARAAIAQVIRRHQASLARLRSSRDSLDKKKVQYAADIAKLRQAQQELAGVDGGLGILPVVVAGAVAGLGAFGGWVYSNIKASNVAQQQAENDAQKIELVEQGKLPPSALTTSAAAGPEGLGNVLKWGAVLVGLFLAFQAVKAGKEAFGNR